MRVARSGLWVPGMGGGGGVGGERRDSYLKVTGLLIGEFKLNPKETNVGVAQV